MVSRNCVAALVVALALAVRAQDLATAEELESIPSDQFIFDPTPSNKVSPGGASLRRTSREWAALEGLGISQTSFTLQPCGVRAPHIHQQASGLLYAIDAESLVVGFVQENGTSVENTITSGTSAVFPQGLVHYQYNNACSEATYTITYNNAEGGTVNIIPALLKLPQEVVEVALGIDATTYETIMQNAPAGNFMKGPQECLERCQVQPASISGRRLMAEA